MIGVVGVCSRIVVDIGVSTFYEANPGCSDTHDQQCIKDTFLTYGLGDQYLDC